MAFFCTTLIGTRPPSAEEDPTDVGTKRGGASGYALRFRALTPAGGWRPIRHVERAKSPKTGEALSPGATWILSRRTTRRHFLLNPDEARQMEQIHWYCLGHAAQLHGVLVHAAYLVANPVEALAVRYAKDSPGAHTLPAHISTPVIRVEQPRHYFDLKNPDWLTQLPLDECLVSLLDASSLSLLGAILAITPSWPLRRWLETAGRNRTLLNGAYT
jgi:hypothetical protein